MDYRLKDPDDMTPEERLDRIVEILAEASIRLINEQQREAAEPAGPHIPDTPASAICPMKLGRLPFGQKKFDGGRVESPDEAALVKRICELAREGLSTDAIAKWLNQEDKTSKRSGKWSKVAVWRILRRQKGKGVTE